MFSPSRAPLQEEISKHDSKDVSFWTGRRCCQCTIVALIIFYIVWTGLIINGLHKAQYGPKGATDLPVKGLHVGEVLASDFKATRSDGKLRRGLTLHVACSAGNMTAPTAPFVFFAGKSHGMYSAAQQAVWLLEDVCKYEPSYSFQVFTSAYPGYSPNGLPDHGYLTQEDFTNDAQDLLEHALVATHGSLDGRAFVGGWSLGCGVSAQVAVAMPKNIAGIVLFAPWDNMHSQIVNANPPWSYWIYPWIWLSSLWDSVAAMASLPPDIPLACVVPGANATIKPWQQFKTCEASTATHKWILTMAGIPHGGLQELIKEHSPSFAQWAKAGWSRVQKFGEYRISGQDASSPAEDCNKWQQDWKPTALLETKNDAVRVDQTQEFHVALLQFSTLFSL